MKRKILFVLIVALTCAILSESICALSLPRYSGTVSGSVAYFSSLDEAITAVETGSVKSVKRPPLNAGFSVARTSAGVYKITAMKDFEIDKAYSFNNLIFDLNGHVANRISSNGCLEMNNGSVLMSASKGGAVNYVNCDISVSDETDTIPLIMLNDSYVRYLDVVIRENHGAVVRGIMANGDSEVSQCTFDISGVTAEKVQAVVVSEGRLNVDDTDFNVDVTASAQAVGVFASGDVSVRNCSFNIVANPAEDVERLRAYGVYSKAADGFIEILDTDIKVRNYSYHGSTYGICIYSTVGVASISGCDVFADSHYLSYSSNSCGILSVGINSSAKYSFLDHVKVHGNHSGMQIGGNGFITDSEFESTGHGGIYFTRQAPIDSAVMYVRDSVIRHCPADGIFKEDVSSENYSGDNRSAFYIGGSATSNGISVYMDGCMIEGDKCSAVLRGSSGERGNALYVSNTAFDAPIRKDSSELSLYIGEGTNVDENSSVYFGRKTSLKDITTFTDCGDSTTYFVPESYRITPDFIDLKPFTWTMAGRIFSNRGSI